MRQYVRARARLAGPSRLLKVALVESRFEKTGSAVAAWWQRRSRGVLLPVPDSGDTGERGQPDDWPPSLPFRKRPKPYSRAIAWIPSEGRRAHVQDRSQPYELFVAQSVLRDVRSHLISSPTTEPFGFLLGHVVYCPWTGAPYVVIDAVRRETQDAPHSGDLDSFRRSWASASREARRRRGQIIGWYHQHGVLGLRLSQSDVRLQEEFFPEAWHCALVVVPGAQGVVGGFIQPTGRAGLYRKGISGFYELVDLDAKLIGGKKPSVVDWTNHRAEERVEIVPAKWPVLRRRAVPTTDIEREEGEEPETEVEAGEKTATASKNRDGLTAQRWEKRASPATKQPAAKKKPAGKTKPVPKRKKKSARTEPAPKVEPAPEEQAATTTGDLTGEFHEAIGLIGLEPDEAPAGSAPTPSSLNDDEGQVAEFLEAVWGPAPFDAEESDEPVLELPLYQESLPRDAPEMSPTLEVAEIPISPNGRMAPFGAEPPETDSGAGSLEWLLGLVEETLSAGLAPVEQTTEEALQKVDEGAVRPPAPEAEGEAAEAPSVVLPPVEQSEPARGTEPPPDGAPTPPRIPAAGRPARPVALQARSAFVGLSEDPDQDREAEIPVVMPTEDGLARFPMLRRRRDRALIAAVLAIAAVSAWFFLGREETPPAFQTPVSVTSPAVRPPARAPEFIRLSGEFTAAIAAYGERGADFQLGRIDCVGLTTGYEALAAAFSALSEYVALAPSGSVDFRPLAEDMREARAGFEASGCGGVQSGAGGPAP